LQVTIKKRGAAPVDEHSGMVGESNMSYVCAYTIYGTKQTSR
jgi:hypothetical protein